MAKSCKMMGEGWFSSPKCHCTEFRRWEEARPWARAAVNGTIYGSVVHQKDRQFGDSFFEKRTRRKLNWVTFAMLVDMTQE